MKGFASLFEKGRVTAMAAMHSLLDRVVEEIGDVEVAKEYARELSEAKDTLGNELAVSRGQVRNLESRIRNINEDIQKTEHNAEILLQAGKEESADQLGAELVGLDADLKSAEEDLKTENLEVTALQRTFDAMQHKVIATNKQIRVLEAKSRRVESKEEAVEAIQNANRALGGSNELSFDNVERKLDERGAIADAQLDAGVNQLGNQAEKDLAEIAATDRLAAIRARVSASKSGTQTDAKSWS